MQNQVENPSVVSRDEWLVARKELLVKEKQLTRARDALSAQRREVSGHSVFYKDGEGAVFHTYSDYGRGSEELLSTYVCLDLTPKGRNENGPGHDLTDWVRHHDRYGDGGYVDRTGRYVAPENSAVCCHSNADGQTA